MRQFRWICVRQLVTQLPNVNDLAIPRLGRVVSGAFRFAVAAASVLSFLLVCKRTDWGSGFALGSTHTMLHCDGSAQQTANSCVGDHRF